ncbi:MAG TPA: FAD-dependent oxidoreductase [Candidatus Binatia bacterium]|jgi:hypothetical protein
MIRDLELRVPATQAAGPLAQAAARAVGVAVSRIRHVTLLRRSLDARPRPAVFQLKIRVWIDEEPQPERGFSLDLRNVAAAAPVLVVGAGPAGLFAALKLIEGGRRPLILERGKEVRARRRDVALLSRDGIVDPDSNYCFGEGGAGTFSDGKLYTRSTKRGEVARILSILVQHGAAADILVDAHPHIGTNRLPAVVQALRQTIVGCGADVIFGARVEALLRRDGRIFGVRTGDGRIFEGDAVVLATGHSARDIYTMLGREKLALEPKPLAMGVRVEHPQDLIDRIQYGSAPRPEGLPAASYSLLHRSQGRGVYSFCMCPGGVICPATTASGEVVVNGWSPSRRNSPWANSGIVVETTVEDARKVARNFAHDLARDPAPDLEGDDALAGMRLQASIEEAAADAGGGRAMAPAQRLLDFLAGRDSASLPACSYPPGVTAADLSSVLPAALTSALRDGFREFGRKMAGFLTEEAIVVGVETRTSAPVRIPRDPRTSMHPQLEGLFPCGEGAGAAGGIVSAAMDGERCAAAVLAAGSGN